MQKTPKTNGSSRAELTVKTFEEKGIKKENKIQKNHTGMIMTETEEENEKHSVFCVLLDAGEENQGMTQVGVSKGPSFLCAGVHGEGGGL